MTITLSPEIHDQVQAKAEQMHLTLDQIVTVLLKRGLQAQEQAEEQLEDLLERHRKGEDVGDQLGDALFG